MKKVKQEILSESYTSDLTKRVLQKKVPESYWQYFKKQIKKEIPLTPYECKRRKRKN